MRTPVTRPPIGSLESSWRDEGDRYQINRADLNPPLIASWLPGGPVSACVREWVPVTHDKPKGRHVWRYRWIRGETNVSCLRCATTEAIRLVAEHRWEEDTLRDLLKRIGEPQAARPTTATDITDRARRYLEKLPPSISGAFGRNAMFLACQVLTRGFALSLDDALPLALEYDARSQPPWGKRELISKLRDAQRRGRMEMRCLVDHERDGKGPRRAA